MRPFKQSGQARDRPSRPRVRPIHLRSGEGPPGSAAGSEPQAAGGPHGPQPPVIDVRDVGKVFALGQLRVRALKQVTMSIRSGELVSIVGSSGSGKSTLMNILGCLDAPTSGRYLIDGLDTSELDEDDLADLRNRRIGFIFQSFNLVARTNALANVELPLAYAGLDRARRRRRAEAALAAVAMSDRLQHQPSELSGGQQQRVAIARAIVTNPSLILADEPTGNLDSHSTEDVLEIFAELHSSGRTIVIITHEPEVAERTQRTLTLADGLIVADQPRDPDAPGSTRSQPAGSRGTASAPGSDQGES